MRKQLSRKGMPFYKDAMSHGFLYIDFDVQFPKSGEIKNADELKKVRKGKKFNFEDFASS